MFPSAGGCPASPRGGQHRASPLVLRPPKLPQPHTSLSRRPALSSASLPSVKPANSFLTWKKRP